LDSACTITIGPNTVSKLWFIENATSGSQNIIIKQGSGATVTIASGKTKVIYSDGVGSGAKMVDAFAALDVGSVSVDNITIDGNEIDVSSGDLTLDVAGDIILDADDEGKIQLQDNGVSYGRLDNNGGTGFDIVSTISDGDVRIRGNDGGATINALTIDMSDAGTAIFNQKVVANSSSSGDYVRMYGGSGTGKWDIYGNGANLRISDNESAGDVQFDTNVGIGCTPNSIESNFDTLQIGGNLTLNVDSTGANAGVYMGNNVYRDSTNSRWEYIYTDEASQYYQANGQHVWRYAAPGSADAAISWNEGMRLDASGRLLLGTSTSFADGNSEDLQIAGSGNTGMMIKSGSASYGSIYFGDSTSGDARNAGILRYFHNDNSMQFWTSEGERVRIDSNGTLMVGKTSSSLSNNGAELQANGTSLFTRSVSSGDGAGVAYFQRNTSDGNIILLYNSSTTNIGGIGVVNDDHLYIGSNDGSDAYIKFSSNLIKPVSNSGADRHDAISLGTSSVRFKDGYFSGSLYGDGSNLTGVGGSTDYGAVGTYIAAYRTHVNDQTTYVQPGQTFSGTGFRKVDGGGGLQCDMDCAQTTANSQTNNQSGTWRAMSSARYNGVYNNTMMVPSALYVRIS